MEPPSVPVRCASSSEARWVSYAAYVDSFPAPENVDDAESFLAFISALRNDFLTRPETWQNETLPDFLEGALSWSEDTHFGITQGLEHASPWKRIAVLLYCGKIYE
jgi:hypothetical protein